MNPSKSHISGRQITRKEAYKGLGDPKKWKKESVAVYAEFRAKPKKQKQPKFTFRTIKKTVQHLSGVISVKPTPQTAFAKSRGKGAPARRNPPTKKDGRRKH